MTTDGRALLARFALPVKASGGPGLAGLLALPAILSAVVFSVAHVANYRQFAGLPLDDAFFFLRYAANFLETGVFEWNRGEGPVYGNTSQFYQVLVTLFYWLTDRNGALSLTLATVSGAMAYLIALAAAYLASAPKSVPAIRALTVATIVSLALFNGLFTPVVSSGMETTWAMALLSLSLLASMRLEAGHEGAGAIILNAAAIALVYATRPDATLIALATPAFLVLAAPRWRTRRAAIAVCIGALLLIGGFLLLCRLYYGDALPLSVITKTAALSLLPMEQRRMLGVPTEQLVHMLLYYKVEAALALAALAIVTRLSAALQGAMIGGSLFVAYHLLFVLPITGEYGRFHAPLMPVLLLMAARAVETIAERTLFHPRWRLVGLAILLGIGLAIGYRAVKTTWSVVALHLSEDDPPIVAGPGTGDALDLAADTNHYFGRRLRAIVTTMDADCAISSTEDGLLSAYASRNRVVDLSGLHDRQMALYGFSAGRVLEQQRPDVLVMPHSWYREWVEALEAHPAMARDYVREEPLYWLGPWIAFRKDSACAARVRQVLYGR